MAITSVKLKSIKVSGNLDSERLTEIYLVITDDTEDCHSVYHSGHASLPQKGESGTEGMAVLEVDCEEVSVGQGIQQVFHYTATWGVVDESWDPNPLNRVEISGEGIEFDEEAFEDYSDPPLKFQNSATDMYNPRPRRVVAGGGVTITINQTANPLNTAFAYSNTTNVATWHGVAIGKAKFGIITFQLMSDPVYGDYWRVSFPILFNKKGWRYKILDQGFNELIEGIKTRIMDDGLDENGEVRKVPRNIPAFLNGSGIKTDTPTPYPADGFLLQEETDWASLSLPNPFTY